MSGEGGPEAHERDVLDVLVVVDTVGTVRTSLGLVACASISTR